MDEREKCIKIFSKMLIMKLNSPFLPIKTIHGIPRVRNEFARATSSPDHSRDRSMYCLQPWAKLSDSGVTYPNKDQRERNTVSESQVSMKNTSQNLSLQKQTDYKHLLLIRECFQQGLFCEVQ